MTFGGRLTLVSGKPAMDADVTSDKLWYAPDTGNTANGITFTSGPTDEVGPSLSLAGLPGNSLHKTFLNSAGGLYLGAPASGSIFSAGEYGAGSYPGHDPDPPLFRLNGVQVNSAGDPYLGTILIDPEGGTCTCHFSQGGKRRWGLWNRYNQRPIYIQAGVDALGVYTPTAIMPNWGPLHDNADNCLTFVTGEPQQVDIGLFMTRAVQAGYGSAAPSGQHECGIGIDRTDANEGQLSSYTLEVGALPTSILNSFSTTAPCISRPLLGAHTAYGLERHREPAQFDYGGNKQTLLWARFDG